MSDFLDVPTRTVSISAGELQLPIRYQDAAVMVALFDVAPEQVEPALVDTGLAPTLMGGRAYVALANFVYRQTGIGPYNEVGVATFAHLAEEGAPWSTALELLRNPRRRRVGYRIFDLPVTSELACAAGREIWGLPKFVTELPIEMHGRQFDGRVLDPDGAVIFTLQGGLPLGVPLPNPGLLLHSQLGDRAVRAVSDVRGLFHFGGGDKLSLSLGESTHPMAERLRSLELPVHPRYALWTHRARMLLHQ